MKKHSLCILENLHYVIKEILDDIGGFWFLKAFFYIIPKFCEDLVCLFWMVFVENPDIVDGIKVFYSILIA